MILIIRKHISVALFEALYTIMYISKYVILFKNYYRYMFTHKD